jgi:hypothetical protein
VTQSTLVDFVIIGTAKAGTTSLYQYLKQHPELCMSQVKETNFFSLEGKKLNFTGPRDMTTGAHVSSITKIEEYERTFSHFKTGMLKGEASPLYSYDKDTAKNIFFHAPKAKIVAILRNPIQRAYSSYNHLIRDQRELLTFSEALDIESERIEKNYSALWHYSKHGFYYEQLKRYYGLFDKSQILVLFHDDLLKNRNATLDELYDFLDVKAGFYPQSTAKHNVGGLPKNKFMHSIVYNTLNGKNGFKSLMQTIFPEPFRAFVAKKIRSTEAKMNLKKYPPISEKDKERLINLYREDIHNLEKLLDKDLSNWLK